MLPYLDWGKPWRISVRMACLWNDIWKIRPPEHVAGVLPIWQQHLVSQFTVHIIHYPCGSITSRLHIGEFVEFNSLIQVSWAVYVTALSLFQELEIKKLAKEGNHEGCKILAKQLIQLRKQKTRTYAASSKVWEIFCHSLVHIYILWIGWCTIVTPYLAL